MSDQFQVSVTPHHPPAAGAVVPLIIRYRLELFPLTLVDQIQRVVDPTGEPVAWSQFKPYHGKKFHGKFFYKEHPFLYKD